MHGSSLYLKFIDCHCHLSDKYFFKDIDQLMKDWEKIDIKKIGGMSINPKTAKRNLEIADKHSKMVSIAIGRHPWGAHKFTEEEKIEFEELIRNKKTEVIGEIGLDYYFVKEKEKHVMQKEMFRFFLDLAEKYKKPIMLHTTGAEREVINTLSTLKPNVNICCHWFSGVKKELDVLIDLGCYFSINPAVLKSQRHSKVLESVPLDRILTESDGPVKFERKHSSPALMPFLCQELARILEMDADQFSEIVFKNYKKYLK